MILSVPKKIPVGRDRKWMLQQLRRSKVSSLAVVEFCLEHARSEDPRSDDDCRARTEDELTLSEQGNRSNGSPWQRWGEGGTREQGEETED